MDVNSAFTRETCVSLYLIFAVTAFVFFMFSSVFSPSLYVTSIPSSSLSFFFFVHACVACFVLLVLGVCLCVLDVFPRFTVMVM